MIGEEIIQFIEQVNEEHDRFIFETIKPYCEGISQMVISKKILCRALEWYKREHLDEYTMLVEEMKRETSWIIKMVKDYE